MSELQKHLLVFSIGPVQGFIAAARKTRDLWFGSHLLSEVAKATAKAVADNGGTLIFPGVENVGELALDSPLSVANVVLAEITGNPKTIADKAKEAATICWKEFAEEAKEKILDVAKGAKVLREDLWDDQINDFLEFQVAWTPLEPENYKASRKRVMRILAGRKACRDFSPACSEPGWGIPKSSLDGARESVLCRNLPDVFCKRLHLRQNDQKGEQLDAIGVVKRFAGGRKSFKSLGLIAIDPHIRDKEGLKKELEDDSIDWDDFDEIAQKFPEFVEKSPYLAILLADGDRMGKAISSQGTAEDHRKLSKALSKFAQGVEKIVGKHHGACVYAGGDDVLAFLPLDTAIECARALHDDFDEKLKDYKKEKDGVSLSVGIVVGHYHEMLENLLEFARAAEKMAKTANDPKNPNAPAPFGDRNGLAICCYSRGNSAISIREQWQDNQDNQDNDDSLDKRLHKWAELFADDKISMKFPYDLRKLGRLYKGIKKEGEKKSESDLSTKQLADAISKGALRMAKQKQIDDEYLKKRLAKLDSVESLLRLTDELMIAQTIGVAVRKLNEGKSSNDNGGAQ